MASDDVQKLTKAQLIARVRELQSQTPGDSGLQTALQLSVIHDLEVHQEEVRIQNEQLQQAQRWLEESRDQYAQLYDFAPLTYLTLDRQGVIESINLTGCTLLGVDRLRAAGSPLMMFVHPDDRRVLLDHLARCRGTGDLVVCELRLRTRRGHVVPVQLSSRAGQRSDSGSVLLRTAIIDLTQLKQAQSEIEKLNAELEQRVRQRTAELEQANRELRREIAQRQQVEDSLRQSEARFRGVVESEMVGIFFWHIDGRITDANRTLLDLIGYTREDLQAGRLRWTGLTPPEYAELEEYALQMLRERGTFPPYEKECIRRDGQRVPVLIGSSFLPGQQNEGVSFVVDVTDRRRWESALRESEARERARTAELQQADRRKDEFLAMLAHELRNPLAPILMASEILNLCGPEEWELLQAQRDVIERQVVQMQRLLNDLLDVSRITRGKIHLNQETVELSAILEAAVEACHPMVDARQHQLAIDIPAEPLWLRGDPARLTQVFTNLINNAAKYTDPCGQITITVARQENEVVVRVRDSGMGMTPEMLATAFELFSQGDTTIDRSQGGLGIGLTLVRSLVDMHGGSVSASSAGPGQGSEFTVRLPAQVAPSDVLPAQVAGARSAQAGRCRVLAVDDNVDAAQVMARLLERIGHEVRVAHDGCAALEIAQSFEPQAVFLDIGLPEMDGYEVARRLRQQPATKDALLVAVTGYGRQEDALQALSAGFDHHLVKPVKFSDLSALMTTHTGRIGPASS